MKYTRFEPDQIRTLLARTTKLAIVIGAAAIIAGCASQKRHHIVVGSVPDDYRTNHPITVSESEQVLDIAVARGAHEANSDQLKTVDGIVASYRSNGTGAMVVMLPRGSVNEAAAELVGVSIANHIAASGIVTGGVNTVHYQAPESTDIAPVRIVYSALTASTGKCGRWPEDITKTSENKHYANFGCSYQNNLAAQLANPNDLNGPRAPGEIDATRRGQVITVYREGATPFNNNIGF